MERWQKIWLVGLTAVVIALASFTFGVTVGRDRTDRFLIGGAGETGGYGIEAIQDAYEKIVGSSVDPPDEEELTEAAIKAMVKVVRRGDPYAAFYTPEGYRSFQEITTGEYSGIGVWLEQRSGRLEVVSVLPSSPALEVGMKRGDRIVEIDGEPVGELTIDDAVGRIKGKAGSEISLVVERAGDRLDFTLERAKLELPNLRSYLTPDSVGYIRLIGFARDAGAQLHETVGRLIDNGAEGIVLDMRDNGGGLFSEGIGVASVFIEDGEIVTYEERGEEPVVYDAEGDAYEDVPLVVLVNQGTASASEIVAGALRDRERAILVGTATYGKGSVQEVLPLLDSSAVKLTIGTYVTPSGDHISAEGIEPDVEVDGTPGEQRRRAIEIVLGVATSGD